MIGFVTECTLVVSAALLIMEAATWLYRGARRIARGGHR